MDKIKALGEIEKKIAACDRCSLYRTATSPVPGNGDPDTKLMFIGESPGFWEDQKGIPFCGAAGKLLDELLISIGLSRGKVFVANILKHRPPENRDPLLEEIQACREYLDDQISIIDPRAIITLGRFSMTKFLPYGKISQDHGAGRIVEFNGKKMIIVPMFHPAAALRAENIDRMLREDFKKIPMEVERLSKPQAVLEEVKKEEKKEEQLTLV